MLLWIVLGVVLLMVLAGAYVDIRDRREGRRIRTAKEIGESVRAAKRDTRAQMRRNGIRAQKLNGRDRGRQSKL